MLSLVLLQIIGCMVGLVVRIEGQQWPDIFSAGTNVDWLSRSNTADPGLDAMALAGAKDIGGGNSDDEENPLGGSGSIPEIKPEILAVLAAHASTSGGNVDLFGNPQENAGGFNATPFGGQNTWPGVKMNGPLQQMPWWTTAAIRALRNSAAVNSKPGTALPMDKTNLMIKALQMEAQKRQGGSPFNNWGRFPLAQGLNPSSKPWQLNGLTAGFPRGDAFTGSSQLSNLLGQMNPSLGSAFTGTNPVGGQSSALFPTAGYCRCRPKCRWLEREAGPCLWCQTCGLVSCC